MYVAILLSFVFGFITHQTYSMVQPMILIHIHRFLGNLFTIIHSTTSIVNHLTTSYNPNNIFPRVQRINDKYSMAIVLDRNTDGTLTRRALIFQTASQTTFGTPPSIITINPSSTNPLNQLRTGPGPFQIQGPNGYNYTFSGTDLI